MATKKHLPWRKAAVQIEVLEARDCPGQTLTGLAAFAPLPDGASVYSEQNNSIGGGQRAVSSNANVWHGDRYVHAPHLADR